MPSKRIREDVSTNGDITKLAKQAKMPLDTNKPKSIDTDFCGTGSRKRTKEDTNTSYDDVARSFKQSKTAPPPLKSQNECLDRHELIEIANGPMSGVVPLREGLTSARSELPDQQLSKVSSNNIVQQFLDSSYSQSSTQHSRTDKLYLIAGDLDRVITSNSGSKKKQNLQLNLNEDSLSYWYSEDDMHSIGTSLLESIGLDSFNVNIQFKNRVTLDLIPTLFENDTTEGNISNFQENKPVFMCYNIGGDTAGRNGGIHWVAVCAIRLDGKLNVLYKDSKGDFSWKDETNQWQNAAAALEAEFSRCCNIVGIGLNFARHDGAEQQDENSCGPMTLKNLQIMAQKIKDDGIEGFINNFTELQFCQQNNVEELRQTFAYDYLPEENQGATEEKTNKNMLGRDGWLLEATESDEQPNDKGSLNGSQETKEEANTDLRSDMSRCTASGLKYTLHGNVYQLGLLTLAAIRALAKAEAKNEKPKFYLISEAQEFEKFDDLVIDYGEKIIYLQAKHGSTSDKHYTKTDLCSTEYNNDASLAKYFDSWYRLRNSEFSKLKGSEVQKVAQYIFFTNKGIKDSEQFLEEAIIDGDEFLFKDLGTKTYRIKSDQKARSEFIDAIIASSEEVKRNPVDSNVNQIEFGQLAKEVKKVADYLKRKFKKQNGETHKEITIDGRSNLSNKERALIKLAREEEAVAKKILGKESKVIKWLQQPKKIIVDISNPLDVLVPKMTTEINDFLDEFIIKVEQPDSHDLAQIILKELGTNIATIGTRELNNALYNYMWEWLSNRSECLLKSEDFGKFIEITESDLHRFYLLGDTKIYKDECKGKGNIINVEHLGVVNGLSDFLTGNDEVNDQSVAVVKDGGGGIKQQLYSIIISIDGLKDAEWSFLHLSSNNINLLPKILTGESTKFYIIDCRSEEIDEDNLNQLKKICQTTIDKKKKLILLIGDEQGELANLISRENSNKFVKFESQPLTDGQIRTICAPYSDKYVSLAGKGYTIQVTIDNKLGSMYELMSDAKYLVQIIESSYEVNLEVESEMPYGVYVPNKMRKGEGYYDLSIITKKIADCYIVERADYGELGNQLRDLFNYRSERFSIGSKNITKETEFVLLKNADDLDKYESQIIILTEKPPYEVLGNRTYISLKTLGNGQFQVTENPSNLYLPFPDGIDFSNKGEQEQFIPAIISSSQLSVLMSPAGYGKTSFCKNIVEKYKSLDSDFSPIWVIKIPLPKLQFSANSNPILDPFIDTKYEWQRVAWERDIDFPDIDFPGRDFRGRDFRGRVFIILDGFDEIKNIETVKLINQWISKIYKNISLLITTRVYAANKLVLPADQNSTFYKLTEYTEEQRDEYIKKYIKAILEETKETEEFNSFVEHITEKIKSKINSYSSGVLGIPLESYIFCELLRPHILSHVKQHSYSLEEESIDVLKDIDVSNVAKLYQEFILSKSSLFLEKHLGINPENIVKKSILFNLMGSYNQIIELYALMQAFDLNDRDEIEKYANSINFDISELKTLEDTGLLRVSKDGRRLSFNHETYQEFYAALAIIRGILSDKGELHEIVKSLVKEHRYDPKFYSIFSIASQFSVSAGAMIPGYSIEKHLLSFWNLLGEDGDVLGAGAISLFKKCISGFSQSEKDLLLSKVEGKKWIKFLNAVAINSHDDEDQTAQNHFDQESLPVAIQQIDIDEEYGYSKDIIDTNKDKVAHVFRALRSKGTLNVKKVKILERAAKNHESSNDYWAYDGGIEAIGYTGRFFSEELAKYLIQRSKYWNNNKKAAIQALITIYSDLNTSLTCDKEHCDEARANCFFVIKMLLAQVQEEQANCSFVIKNNNIFFNELLNLVNIEFLNYLKVDLIKQLLHLGIKIDEVNLSNPASIFASSFEIMKSILLVAEKLKYAVLMDKSENKITLIKDTQIEIQFGEGTFSPIFANLMFNLLERKFASNKAESYISAISLDNKSISTSGLQEIEKYIVDQLKNEELFNKFFDRVKDDGENFLCLYEILFEYEYITKHNVGKYIAELKTGKATKKGEWWSSNGGIEIAGYTGIYFNEDIAEYLKLRAGYWPGNESKAIEALKQIHDTLVNSNIDKSNEDYVRSVQAYNQCIDQYNSKFSELESIELDMPTIESGQAILETMQDDSSLETEMQTPVLGETENQF